MRASAVPNEGEEANDEEDADARLLALLNDLGASQTTSTTRSNETDLLTGRVTARSCRSVTNVLMVTSSVRVIHRVHRHTTNAGPLVALGLVLEVSATGLEQGLLHTTSSSDDTDHGTAVGGDDLLESGGKLDSGDSLIRVVRDDRAVVAGAASEDTTVTGPLLEVADDGSLGHVGHGQDVADGQGSLLSCVDELTGVHALDGKEELLVLLELVGVAEDDASERSTTSLVVDDLSDDTLEVSVPLSEVTNSVLGLALAVVSVSSEDAIGATPSLCSNNTTHGCGEETEVKAPCTLR